MHSVAEVGANVPAFLAKLWKLVEDPDFDELICWSENGDSFIIHNQAQFCRELLPLYYKHNNMASFVRQLNMYGFHKKVNVEGGGLKVDRDEMEFAHPYFARTQPHLLERIKRKIAESGRGGATSTRGSCGPEVMNKVLGDVKTVKGRQDNLDSKLGAMKRENEALWRELACLRQKHIKQQQIVNKLIQFLMTVVQSPNRGLNVKRRAPLMLNDKAHHHHHHHHRHHRQQQQGGASPSTSTGASISAPVSPADAFHEDSVQSNDGSGPTIHELDPGQEFLLREAAPVLDEDEDARSASPAEPPSPSELGLSYEAMQEPAAGAATTSMALMNPDEASQTSISRDELGNHVDQVQTDLDGLKELLQNDNYSIDANTLLSLFSDDPLSLNMGLPSQDRDLGNELISYNSSLFDLADEAAAPEQADVASALFPDAALADVDPLAPDSELETPVASIAAPDFSQPPAKRKKP